MLVVGAGPTGLALACGLRAAGVPIRIVDAADGPAVTSRALGLHPRGMEVLDRLGALGDLPARGMPVRAVAIYVGDREVARLRLRPTRLVTRPGVTMSQASVESALRRRLAALGTEVTWNRPVTDVTAEDAEWIVGCDGAHSGVRKSAGIGFPGVPLVERFLIADVRAALALPRDVVHTWLRGDEMFGLFPLPGTDMWRILMPQGDRAPGEVSDLFAECTGLPASAITEQMWTSTFRIHRRLADTYRSGRVLLAGDAAHIHSPFGGQGMNTGLGDAENLAWKLALVVRHRCGTELLDTYQAERRPIAAQVLDNTSSLTHLMLGRGAVARLLRDHVVVPLMDRPLTQRLITETSSQLRVSYRRGPLADGRAVARAPRPGDRVPDLSCRRADGSPTRLHAEWGGRWVIVTADDHAARVACTYLGADAVTVLRPDAGVETLLVRPDGHLACRGDARRMDAWLSGVLRARAEVPVSS
ncbi:oxygenase [Mangrovihabitans endophyticus]|uniref:Oxygenase n=1 Tax=Mangrovihabitans endophyticus TaxID=1751298 RepID=A0A8J3C278_9ACTN|nr:oxygenase [Mangrovihabitans endophyticus]